MAKIYKYQKGKGYIVGLPTIDIPESEWKTLPKELTKPALQQGIYKVEKPETDEVTNA